ncbi:MAG: hypothetical protein U0270_24480 [Labilithrix sp.]
MFFPFELADGVALLIVTLLAVAVTWMVSRRNGQDERRLFALSLAMHLVFSQLLLYLQSTIYTDSDAWGYRSDSMVLYRLLEVDPGKYVPEVLAIIFRLKSELMEGVGQSSTMSMVALVALGRFVTFDSYWALYAISACASFFGKWAIYAVFRDELQHVRRRILAVATMCVPSVVFWTSGVVKEAYAVAGLGALCYGMCRLFRVRAVGVIWAFIGATFVGIFKPYVLFPFAVGAMGWLVFERSKSVRAHAPIYFLVGVIGGIGLVIALSALFPQFSPTNIAEQTALQQFHGASAGGGSVYSIQTGDGGVNGQLAAAPLALLTVLARPFPWEAKGVPTMIASIEMTILTFLLLWALLKGRFSAIGAAFLMPPVLFSVMFILVGGIAIGLATTNFGTLSRYRVPIMPFYAVLVVHLSQHTAAAARSLKERGPKARSKTGAMVQTAGSPRAS